MPIERKRRRGRPKRTLSSLNMQPEDSESFGIEIIPDTRNNEKQKKRGRP